MSRRAARLRLAWESLRQAASPEPQVQAGDVTSVYGVGGLSALPPRERSRLPLMSRCVACGLCALVIRRAGYTRLPDLAGAYLRDPGLLPAAETDLRGGDPGADALAAAAAVCPVGVPLDELVAVIRRMADPPHEARTPPPSGTPDTATRPRPAFEPGGTREGGPVPPSGG